MRRRRQSTVAALGGFSLILVTALTFAQEDRAPDGDKETDMGQRETVKSQSASGTFEVELGQLPMLEADDGIGFGRMSISKRFEGDLEGTSKGQMMSAMTGVKGSAGYVAIEQVSGTLKGRRGTFVLQHSSTMQRGEPEQSIIVVPDSGTGELVGLAGSMTIEITGGEHRYSFEYRLE